MGTWDIVKGISSVGGSVGSFMRKGEDVAADAFKGAKDALAVPGAYLSGIGGAIGVADGIKKLTNGDSKDDVSGGFGVWKGMADIAKGACTLAKDAPGAGVAGLVSGAADFGSGIYNWAQDGLVSADDVIGTAKGVAGMVGGVASLAGSAPVAAVAASGSLGLTVGKVLAHAIDDHTNGWWGTDKETGKGLNAFDVAARAGEAADHKVEGWFGSKQGDGSVGDYAGDAAGIATAAAGSIAGAALTPAAGAVHGAKKLFGGL